MLNGSQFNCLSDQSYPYLSIYPNDFINSPVKDGFDDSEPMLFVVEIDGVEYLDSSSGLPDEGEGNGKWDGPKTVNGVRYPGESYDDFNQDGNWNSYVEPAEFSAYIQNTFEVPWMVINAGIRADAVNFNTKIWSEPEFFNSEGDRDFGEFSPERPWFWSDCGLDGLCSGEPNYDTPWNEVKYVVRHTIRK